MINPIQLKRAMLYAAIVIAVIITWSQLESIKFFADHKHPTPSIVFSQKEMDPPTWLIQTLENEPILKQPSIFPAAVFSRQNPRQYPPATAIVNRVDDSDDGILHAIEHLFKYPFIKEILVYNQIKSRPLKAEVKKILIQLDVLLFTY
ncbi:hypothetical protein G6F42_021933 [Rhizopus arrhizus]|nr:hypothetical protein G6F42_021933 [Rhizopus arrhizus]